MSIIKKKFFNMKTILLKLINVVIPFVVLFPLLAQAQEQLVGLYGNPVIEQFLKNHSGSDKLLKSQKITTVSPLWLPFFDDFTYEGPYPDSMRWEDNFVFVNSSFQKNPVNRGVATLDALDAEGKIYAHASPYPFIADYLTSRPIRTDSVFFNEKIQPLMPFDSLYLSFYYQPQGIGNAPERHDSLVLEFFVEYEQTEMYVDSIYHPADTIWSSIDPPVWDTIYEAYWQIDTTYIIFPEQWKRMWASPGMPLDTFYTKYGQWMVPVMIPITDIVDFRPDFRFRFRNYASLPNNILPSWQSNMDQWNIDYVYLRNNRSWSDTTYQDISFVNPGESFIQDFAAMPHRQYAADPYNSIKKKFTTALINLDNTEQNATYAYRIYDPDGNQIGTDEQYHSIEWTNRLFTAGNAGIQSLDVNVVMMFPPEQGIFSIKQTLTGDVDANPRLSDSITYLQEFGNHFAYDDGTPEAGYGLTPAKAILAVRFPLNTADTLQAVDIFFNTTPARQSSDYMEHFKLMVWLVTSTSKEPNDSLLIYTSDEILYGNEAGKFIRFPIKETVLVPRSGFFVGIQQSTAENMNIGFDYSNDMHSRNLYKIYNDPWKTSSYQGSIMIRPIMGTSLHIIPPPPENSNPKNIAVYPNPLTSGRQIYVQKPESFDNEHEITLKLYDGIGKQCYEAPYTQPEVRLENIHNGVFIIKLYNYTTGETATTKLMITH